MVGKELDVTGKLSTERMLEIEEENSLLANNAGKEEVCARKKWIPKKILAEDLYRSCAGMLPRKCPYCGLVACYVFARGEKEREVECLGCHKEFSVLKYARGVRKCLLKGEVCNDKNS